MCVSVCLKRRGGRKEESFSLHMQRVKMRWVHRRRHRQSIEETEGIDSILITRWPRRNLGHPSPENSTAPTLQEWLMATANYSLQSRRHKYSTLRLLGVIKDLLSPSFSFPASASFPPPSLPCLHLLGGHSTDSFVIPLSVCYFSVIARRNGERDCQLNYMQQRS